MVQRCKALLALALLLACLSFVTPLGWRVSAASSFVDTQRPRGAESGLSRAAQLAHTQRPSNRARPGPTIEAYIRPEFARQMRALRPTIMAAAERHNRPEWSRMSDQEFAMVIALLLYNENFGSLEEQVVPLRALTPFYQDLQTRVNEAGANLSVWPANLRPSVALEILRQQVPVPAPTKVIIVPLTIAGSQINLRARQSQQELYAAVTAEITRPPMAVEYLAANLERGLYRAHFEGLPVTWRTLAAWHNQGIVAAREIRRNPTAADYLRRTSAYLPAAMALIDTPSECHGARCRVGDASEFVIGPQRSRW